MPQQSQHNETDEEEVERFLFKLLVLLALLVLTIYINILLFNVVDLKLGNLTSVFSTLEPLFSM